MPANSVKVRFLVEVSIGGKEVPVEKELFVSPRRARQLRKDNAAAVVSFEPYVLKLTKELPEVSTLQRWGSKSEGVMKMNSAMLNRRLPRA